MRSIAVLACGCGLVCVMGACGGGDTLPLTQEEATQAANENVAHHLDEAAKVAASFEESSLSDLLGDLFPAEVVCSSGSPDSGSGTEPVPGPADAQGGADVDPGEVVEELVEWLKANVFHEDFAESAGDKTVVYRLDPQVLCAGEESVDQGCADLLEKVPVRLSASSPREGDLDVRVLVGADERSVGTVSLHKDEIVLRADLAGVKWFLEQVAEQEEEPPAFPDVAQGTVELRLAAGEQGVSVRVSVVEAVRVAYEQGDMAGLELKLAKADSAQAMQIKRGGERIELSSGWGAIDVALPGALICGDDQQSGGDGGSGGDGSSGLACGNKESEGTLSAHLDGLSGTVVLDGDASEVRLDDLGLGDSSTTLKLNSDRLAKVDLNPDAGRRFSALIAKVAGGIEVTVEPALDLKVAMTLMHLSETAAADLPEWLADEIFEVMLGGDPKAKLLIPTDDDPCDDTPAGQAKMIEGRLTLSASSVDNDVVVPAGQCISSAELEDAHPFETIAPSACE